MTYSPRGRAALCIQAMRNQPKKREWTVAEIAAAAGVDPKLVGDTLDYPTRHGIVFRIGARSTLRYSLKPLEPARVRDPHPKAVQVQWEPREDWRNWHHRAVPWTPPTMACVRPGTDPLPQRTTGAMC